MDVKQLRSSARKQRGAYAVEFALVFLIFFTLLYGIICYGMVGGSRLDSPCCSETISDSLRSWRDQQEHPSEEEMGGNRYMESE